MLIGDRVRFQDEYIKLWTKQGRLRRKGAHLPGTVVGVKPLLVKWDDGYISQLWDDEKLERV
jgi:hypothetical protein